MLITKPAIEELFDQTARMHKHLCPRQVLGVRMGLFAGEMLEMKLPQNEKRLFTIVETDGCFADGVSVSTNCWLGRRTLRHEDLGKVAATFIDTNSGFSIRISPGRDCRSLAKEFSNPGDDHWEEMLIGYQNMPYEILLDAQEVELNIDIMEIISKAGIRHICSQCGEEILNNRHLISNHEILCRSCHSPSYYSHV